MSTRVYSRRLTRTAVTVWAATLLLSLPFATLMVFLRPDASVDEIATVILIPMVVFFLLVRICVLVTPPRQVEAASQERASSRFFRLAALLSLVVFVALPSAFLYSLLDLPWATRLAGWTSVIAIATIITALVLRRLQGGAKNLVQRMALVPTAAVALATTGVIGLSGFWTTVATKASATLTYHRP
jgi:hypothetical protein